MGKQEKKKKIAVKQIILIKDLFVLTKAWQEEWERLFFSPRCTTLPILEKKKLAVAAACH